MLANQWYEEAIAQQRRSDMIRQAEHERTVRQMISKRSPSMVSLRRSFGQWLIVLGQRIQAPQPSLRKAHEW